MVRSARRRRVRAVAMSEAWGGGGFRVERERRKVSEGRGRACERKAVWRVWGSAILGLCFGDGGG